MGVGASRSLRMTGWYFALRSEPCGEAFTLRCALLKARDPSSAKRTQDDGEGRCFAYAQDDGVALCAPLRMTVRPLRLPERSEAGRMRTLPAPPVSIRFSTEPTKPVFSLCPVLPRVPQWCQTPYKTLSSGERRLGLFLPQHGRRINRTNQLG